MADTKIFVVDDSEAERYVKCRILREAGFEVDEGCTGEEAIVAASSRRVHLMVLDVKLPDMSGYDVCRRIKNDFPSIGVLQTSAAFTTQGDRLTGLAGGADAYLIEPIAPDELVATVNTLARLYRAEQELRQANETLEQRIVERTRELSDANAKLAQEMEQRALAEEKLRHSQKLDALGQITGGIAHDFNNLLTVVLGSFSWIERRLRASEPHSTEQVLQHLAAGRKAALDCEYLTRQLLAFARKDELRIETVDANDKLRVLTDLITRAMGEQVSLELHLEPGLWACRVDPSQLEAALLNLAVNARDAMASKGKLTIETENLMVVSGMNSHNGVRFPGGMEVGDYVAITVGDTGAGMDEDVLGRAFEPFFTTKDVGKGSGLGLSQVYGFVTHSGGYVGVTSAVGRGTRIALYLPRALDAIAKRATVAPSPDHLPRGTETVLVVEDNFLVLDYTVQTLTDLGYRVLEAGDGPRALKVLSGDDTIDLLFTDMVMPNDMTGIDLAEQARTTHPGLKVLLTSGYAADKLSASGNTVEFAYLAKPYSPESLARRVREVLETGNPASAP